MPKKKANAQSELQCVQMNVRVTPSMMDRIDAVSSKLGLDVSNLMRLVLNECIPIYEVRAERIQRRQLPRDLGDLEDKGDDRS